MRLQLHLEVEVLQSDNFMYVAWRFSRPVAPSFYFSLNVNELCFHNRYLVHVVCSCVIDSDMPFNFTTTPNKTDIPQLDGDAIEVISVA